MSQLNVDPQEIAKFEAFAAIWWDQHSEFRPLHMINPLRLNWIDEHAGGLSGKKVLDVGCGDGSLMTLLKKEKNIEVRGLELNQENVQHCIRKGLPVIQGNAETELHQFPN